MSKILLVDIETFPLLMYAWTGWEANSLRTVEDTSLASFSAKWLGGAHITKALCDYPDYKAGSRDDSALLVDLWGLLDQADQVVAHNGDRFDNKKITYRFMVHKMLPPSPYATIDTLKAVRSVASFDSHKLNDLSQRLKLGKKVATGGADLWFDCLAGDKAAWKRMKKYNAHDVRLLESLYLELRPWMKKHPNVGAGEVNCPKCGSANLQSRGTARSTTRTYQRFQCTDCGGWARSTKAEGSAKITNAA